MAKQLLMSANETMVSDSELVAGDSDSTLTPEVSSGNGCCVSPAQPLLYQAEQQTKLLNLQAEVESLLEHLKALEQERLALENAAVKSEQFVRQQGTAFSEMNCAKIDMP